MEEILFESEETLERAAVADLFRAVADRLDAGEPITLSAGGEAVELDPPARPTVEVKAEREGARPDAELSVEFELEWAESESGGGGDGGGLDIS